MFFRILGAPILFSPPVVYGKDVFNVDKWEKYRHSKNVNYYILATKKKWQSQEKIILVFLLYSKIFSINYVYTH